MEHNKREEKVRLACGRIDTRRVRDTHKGTRMLYWHTYLIFVGSGWVTVTSTQSTDRHLHVSSERFFIRLFVMYGPRENGFTGECYYSEIK